jgi:hypothetical protein
MRARALARRSPIAALSALAALAAVTTGLSCSGGEPRDLTRLRVFFTSDAIGYLEPCG